MTRSKLMQIKVLVLLCILATTGATTALPPPAIPVFYSSITTGCVASITQCSFLAHNNGINLEADWICYYNSLTNARMGGANITATCKITNNNGCCDFLDAGNCPTIANCPATRP
jgi:hypothetical protein